MSLLSVATQVYGETRMVMRVAPGAFNPPPAVQSAVVRIDVAPRHASTCRIDVFFRVVRAGFGNPRKQLRNSLSFGLHVKQIGRRCGAWRRRHRCDAAGAGAVRSTNGTALARAWIAGDAPMTARCA